MTLIQLESVSEFQAELPNENLAYLFVKCCIIADCTGVSKA
jgi:hypothetical protein